MFVIQSYAFRYRILYNNSHLHLVETKFNLLTQRVGEDCTLIRNEYHKLTSGLVDRKVCIGCALGLPSNASLPWEPPRPKVLESR